MSTSSGRTTDHHGADMVCVARVHDYLRGGTHSFSVEREYADADPDAARILRPILRRERAFLTAAVLFMLDRGIHQFLDLGSGLPSEGGVHDITSHLGARVRVVHVDSDPAVVEHGRLIVEQDAGWTHFLLHDAAQPSRVLTECVTHGMLNLNEPVGVLAIGLPHLLPSPRSSAFLPLYGTALVRGSAVALTHLTPRFAGTLTPAAERLIAGPRSALFPRRRRKVLPMLAGFDIVKPGVLSLSHQWSPGPPLPNADPAGTGGLLAGLGVKP